MYNSSGIYQLNCLDCSRKYIAQTGRTFDVQFRKHIHPTLNNKPDTWYSNHVLDTGHTYGKIRNTVVYKNKSNKNENFKLFRKMHISNCSNKLLQVNKFNIDYNNPIFEVVYLHSPY